ncbi:MAG: MiaB/RimO family radical SAM methylthiotransferase [Oscillospiraceae bacterium]|nr:MiaB/RimO family radical SAM methylthiotransferase [Oscillospiraceae bacterium]
MDACAIETLDAVCGLNADFHKAEGRKKVARVLTFGCKMNENDSEKIMGLLVRMGFDIEPSPASGKFGNPSPLGSLGGIYEEKDLSDRSFPDLVILNTCCVRGNAEQRFYGILGSLKRYKSDDPSRVLAVCGCMMQEESAVSKIKKQYGYVDFVFGTRAISSLPSLLHGAYLKHENERRDKNGRRDKNERRKAGPIPVSNDIAGAGMEDGLPMSRKAPPLALVSVMNGCDNFCSYCIVPYVRGREQSRSPESIAREVELLASEGYREITLLGQNVNSYGGGANVGAASGVANNDAASCVANIDATTSAQSAAAYGDFAGLLARLSTIDGIWRIRFMTSHPKDLSDRLIYAIRDLDAVCPQLHLPVQSGSTQVLERMNRGYSRDEYIALTRKVRDAVPDITLTTDVIVGFPGESERDFDDTLGLVDEVGFDLAYTFIFSPREGTAAAGFGGRVHEAVVKDRFERLQKLQNKISYDKNLAAIGNIYEVLCEGASKTNKARLTGRTPGGKVVNFRIGGDAATSRDPARLAEGRIGKLVRVRIEEAHTWSLDGAEAPDFA